MKKGFTLVELAAVILIIGLIAGGVMGGHDIIEQYKIGSTLTQIHDYDTAASAFKLKYGGLPGDIENAEDLGLDKDAQGTVNTVVTSDGASRNGNNDGLIQDNTAAYHSGSLAAPSSFDGELANFWIHLTNAQLISGTYLLDNGTPSLVAGVGYPTAKAGGKLIAFSDNISVNYYMVGAGPYMFNDDLLTVYEASAIDRKADDGKPSYGTIRTRNMSGMMLPIIPGDESRYCGLMGQDEAGRYMDTAYNIKYPDNRNCTLVVEASF